MSMLYLTQARLKQILIDHVGVDAGDIPEIGDIAFADLDLDSLAVVELQLAVQREYGVRIADEHASELRSCAALIDYVNVNLSTRKAA